MKFIKPSFEILDIPEPNDHMGVLKFLERVGRVCYKSEDKITDESCIKFLQNIRNRKHWAMLEHYIFTIVITYDDYHELLDLYKVIDEDNPDLAEKLRFIHITKWDKCPDADDRRFLVSGSPTAFNYLWACKMFRDGGVDVINMLCRFLYKKFPEIMCVPEGIDLDKPYLDVETMFRFLSRDEIASLPLGLQKIHDFASVKSITDRGVTHEDVRHRPASWAQESTRYCNYGKTGCTFIIPCWFTDEESEILIDMTDDEFYRHVNQMSMPVGMSLAAWNWVADMMYIGREYEKFVKQGVPTDITEETITQTILERISSTIGYGWSPQESRSVLPNSVKTEIIMTANLNEWEHYFNMRVPKTAHPQMRELTVPMLKEFADRNPYVFFDQKQRLLEENK